MGSAAGREKCNKYFWSHGYRAGYTGSAEQTMQIFREPLDAVPSYRVAAVLANTTGKSFQGLYRMGYAMGLADRQSKRKSREFTGYSDRHSITMPALEKRPKKR